MYFISTTDESVLPDQLENENYSNFENFDEQPIQSLSDQEKLIILIIAVSLFFITLLITICIVSPNCLISKLIKKLFPKTSDQTPSNNLVIKQQFITPGTLGTKNFQLTVVPCHLNEKKKLDLKLTKNDLNVANRNGSNEPINLYNSLDEPNLKCKLIKDIFQNHKEINCNTLFMNNKNLGVEDAYNKWSNESTKQQYDNNLIYGGGNGLNGSNGLTNRNTINDLNNKNLNLNNNFNNSLMGNDQIEIIMALRTEKLINPTKLSNNLRLIITLKQIKYLPLKANGLEPSFYCTITGMGNINSTFRKAINQKLSAKLNNLLYYQSETFKPRTLSPIINLKYCSEELSKNVLKDAKLLIRIMAVEKHANDTCLGELMINLKQVLKEEKTIDKNNFNEREDVFKCYKLQRSKEIKGELLLATSFLPTSRRATFSISKANLNNQLNIIDFNQNYFVRVIMCFNGKVIKKKKTQSSNKLDWQENETLTFDLSNLSEYQLEQLCFLVVLCCTPENHEPTISSPSSPGSPNSPINDQINGYNNFTLNRNSTNEMEIIKRKVDKNLQKKDNFPIGHWILDSQCWSQITHEPRKNIRRWVKLV